MRGSIHHVSRQLGIHLDLHHKTNVVIVGLWSQMASETGLDRQTWCKNGIDLRGLQLEHNHRVACDAWSRQREQPLTVSVRVSFRQPFTTAAANDALDDGTLHYGHLAKRLRAIKAASEWECLQGLSDRIHDTVCEPTKAAQLLQSCEVELHLPKASLLGKGITFTSRRSYVDQTLAVVRQNMLQLSSVNIATIVGVNSNEREHKQPLLFDVWVYNLPRNKTDVYTVLEDLLVKVSDLRCPLSGSPLF